MEEVEVEIIIPELPDVPRVLDGLAGHLGLEPHSLGMTTTFDRMVDTDDMALLSKDHSLRVRQKLENTFSGNEFRLTYKQPLREHERMFIRREQKLTLNEPEFERVLFLLSSLSEGVSGQELKSIMEIRELAREANLGEKGSQLNISVDNSTYYKPGAEEPGAEEYVFEIESHGVPEDLVLKAADWVLKELGGREAASPKYVRGLRKLGML